MKHYIVPTLEKKPDELILHIGTNDLKDRAPKEIVRDIMALKEFVVKSSPQTKVTVSELVLRTDDKKLNDKVKNVNELLKKSCDNYNLSIIGHADMILMASVSINQEYILIKKELPYLH